eukprot:gene17998-biopygen8372
MPTRRCRLETVATEHNTTTTTTTERQRQDPPLRTTVALAQPQ